MLHDACIRHMHTLVDPSVVARHIQQEMRNFPDIEIGIRENLPTRRFRELERVIRDASTRVRSIRDLLETFDGYRERLKSVDRGRLPTANLPIPTVQSLMGDVEAMERRFAKLLLGPQMIAVVTDDIKLSDGTNDPFNFGPFKIVLDLHDYATDEGSSYYTVRACSPRCPENHEDMEHPHTSNFILCEGSASNPIERALNEGRFFDFFHIVNNTLQVYNASSPHLKLGAWTHNESDMECSDCGDSVDEGDDYRCTCCDNTFCSSCSTYCEGGDISLCNGCRENRGRACPGCDQYGAQECEQHVNDRCMVCSNVVPDDDFCECRDGGICNRCVDRLRELPSACDGCCDLESCSIIPEVLKTPDEDEDEAEAATESVVTGG